MEFNEYQVISDGTAIYPGKGTVSGLYYTALGLGEAGEVQGKVKKIMRDNGGVLNEETCNAIAKELGDLLWYVSQTATELGLELDDVAEANINKLADRRERGVIQGSGDDR